MRRAYALAMHLRVRTFVTAAIAASAIACSSSAEDVGADTDEGALAEQRADEPVSRDRIPEPQAFLGWRDEVSAVSPPRPADAKRVEVACADHRLFPTQPASSLKRYHRYSHGRYDHFKVSGDSPVCKIPNQTLNSRRERPCAAAAGIDYAMLSDTYADSCGHFYRGFWDALYLTTDESMGTLMSKGRTVYEVPRSPFAGEVYDAQTYAVEASEFALLSELGPGDAEQIAKAKESAIRAGTHRYDPNTLLFEYTGPHRR